MGTAFYCHDLSDTNEAQHEHRCVSPFHHNTLESLPHTHLNVKFSFFLFAVRWISAIQIFVQFG